MPRIPMELVQARIVTGDVERLAAFYARLVDTPVTLNEYYVEVPAGAVTVGFSHRRFAECPGRHPAVILDFVTGDVDAEYERIAALGVKWVTPPTTQPWGNSSMIFTDPEGQVVNVFSRGDEGQER